MDDSFGGMFKLTGSNYSIWKSKMRDMLVCKPLWLLVQYGKGKLDKIDASTWEVMHLKEIAYIRCFIDIIVDPILWVYSSFVGGACLPHSQP